MELQTLVESTVTPDDVLAILRDQHRHQCEYDPEADPDFQLSFDTTVDDWRFACDLVGWRQLARALNQYWHTEIPIHEWRSVLVPPKKRVLRDVCELLAARASTEVVSVPVLLGRRCAPAGVFFAVREILARDGAAVSQLRPSTPLDDYAARHALTIAGLISELAPGALPVISIQNSAYARSSCFTIVCFIGFLASLAVVESEPWLWIVWMTLTIVSWFWFWHCSRSTPECVSFGELRTFRELCVTLAPRIRQ